MFQTPNRRRGYGRAGEGEKTRLKGLFADGVWKCDCDPRMIAEHFQTKNGGPNHGRWFYTCQKPQGKRCGFFLWDDVAKPREARAVLSNSRTEPAPQLEPTTPSRKPSTSHLDRSPITPYSNSRAAQRLTSDFHPASSFAEPKHARENEWLYVSDEDFDDAALRDVADKVSMPPPPETPSKVARTTAVTSPGKRRFADFQEAGGSSKIVATPGNNDVFATPNSKFRQRDSTSVTAGSATKGPGSLMTPGDTQRTSRTGPPRDTDLTVGADIKPDRMPDESPLRNKSTNSTSISGSSLGYASTTKEESPPESELATEMLDTYRDLHNPLGENTVTAVKWVAHRYIRKLWAVERGRDVSRQAVRARDARVKELEAEVKRLKALIGEKAL